MMIKLGFACPLTVAVFVEFLYTNSLDYINRYGDIDLIRKLKASAVLLEVNSLRVNERPFR